MQAPRTLARAFWTRSPAVSATGLRSEVADEDSGLRRRSRDQLERPCPTVIGEQPLAATEHDRLNHQAVLVDEVVGDELYGKRGAPHDLDTAAVARSKLAHCSDGIVGRQQRRVRPVEIALSERAGYHV